MDRRSPARQDAQVALRQGSLWSEPTELSTVDSPADAVRLADILRDFRCGERATERRWSRASDGSCEVEVYANQFWTPRQRDANALHEVSYRACFKPALPRFFCEWLTVPGQRVHDPFLGRGTTAIEAALLGRIPSGCDVNPLSLILAGP